MTIIRWSFDFKINGAPLRIFVNGERPNLVHTNEYRPQSITKTNFATIVNKLEAHEFADDMQRMLKLFEKQYQPHQNLFSEVLAEMCMIHIEKYGRLMVSDLHVYIDELLIAVKHFELEKDQELYVEQGIELWTLLNDQAQVLFKKYLWIPSPLPPHQPIKLHQ